MKVTTRAATTSDRNFLLRVYGSTREEELARVPWGEAERAAFIAMQFDLQDRHYQQVYPHARYAIIEADGEPAGRLYLHHGAQEIIIIDIALLPQYRNLGIGGGLLRGLLDEATATGKPVTIHVERFNPALRLYARLGFRAVADRGVYLLLRRDAPAPGSGEDRLVAHPATVGAEGDQEEVERAERLMRESIDLLGQGRARRTEE